MSSWPFLSSFIVLPMGFKNLPSLVRMPIMANSTRRPEAAYAGAVAIDGSKFKEVNSRDRNFTPAKIAKRKQQIEESIERYMGGPGSR